MKTATVQQMKELDQVAIEKRGIPSGQLMECAAAALAGAAGEMTGTVVGRQRRAVCFCGAGNNGGDGIAAARLLLEAGWEVRCILVGRREKMTPDCREMALRLTAAGGMLEDFSSMDPSFASWSLSSDVMIDAIFGIGLHAELRDDALTAVHMMNTCDIPVLSADIASGVEADTGRILDAAVKADRTVTFTLPKVGHFVGKGQLCCGTLTVADIGIPSDLIQSGDYPVHAVLREDLYLPRRPRDAHKSDFGRAYILGGSMGFSGAPVMAAKAAVCTGAGLVSVGVPIQVWPVAAAKLEEAMVHPLPAGKEGMLELGAAMPALEKINQQSVCLIGPGLGRSNAVASVVRNLLLEVKRPIVLDADGINALAGHIDVLDARRGGCTILTPHDGEFERLTGSLPGPDRLGAARNFAMEHGCCLVLKGHRTITAFPDGAAYVNTTGNPGMARGGSGDILGGVLVSLLAQGFTPREAVPMAVWIHGRAGDICAEDVGEYGMTQGDVLRTLPRVLHNLERP